MKTNNFPHYLQLDVMDCGPTCLCMIAKYCDKTYSLQALRSRSFITRQGVSMLGISDEAESIVFRTSGVRISLQQLKENCVYETEVANAVASMINAISECENNFLFISPVTEKIAFLQPWRKNQNAETGENIFVVIPAGALQPVGKALLPMDGSGKVEVGQRVIIRLLTFPEQEFGFIKEIVASISPVLDSESRYVLEISLPEALKTTYGKELPLVKIMSGTTTIVTKERSMLKRLLNYNF